MTSLYSFRDTVQSSPYTAPLHLKPSVDIMPQNMLRCFSMFILLRCAIGQTAQIVNEQVIVLGPSNSLMSTPRPGISGFGQVVLPQERQAIIPETHIVQTGDDDNNVEIVAIERPVLVPTVDARPPNVQDLVFVDPINGDIVSVTYNPTIYPVPAPVKYQQTYRLANARRFPLTYGPRRPPTFTSAAQNSYLSDHMFYDSLRSTRRGRLQQTVAPPRQRISTTPASVDNFWDRYLYMLM
ncbi:hypothetical protein FSP39_013517 [Pinctada imbricata]|uniref:Uncharacterized protein n=1 Tax=Pinctada imbricata TaxID=66713 RepID=A0AA88Y4N9_PINIB|nr:hypothetical protein FSP39_013517 [Pinctada imbricata]